MSWRNLPAIIAIAVWPLSLYPDMWPSFCFVWRLGTRMYGCPISKMSCSDPDSNVHGANMGPTWVLSVGPRWAPWWPHEPCYQGTWLKYIRPETGRGEGSAGWIITPTVVSAAWNLTPTDRSIKFSQKNDPKRVAEYENLTIITQREWLKTKKWYPTGVFLTIE